MPTLLDDALVTDTLKALPGWEGDANRIWRDIHVAPDVATELKRQVAVDASSMGHQPTVEDIPGGCRFILHTGEVGGVSELDIVMASHISDLTHRLATTEPGIQAKRSDDAEVVFTGGQAGEADPTVGILPR